MTCTYEQIPLTDAISHNEEDASAMLVLHDLEPDYILCDMPARLNYFMQLWFKHVLRRDNPEQSYMR